MFANYKNYIQYVLPLFFIWLLYSPALSFGFIWDDFNYIVNNQMLSEVSKFSDIWLTTKSVDFWPLSYSYFWVIKYFFGVDPFYFHFFNTILFSASTVLLIYLLNILGVKGCAFLGLIYAVHPMNTSAVTWVFQAKTNLAIIFGLLSFIFFIFYEKKQNFLCYTFFCILMCLSYLSKISLIGLPILFLMYWMAVRKFNLKEYSKVLAVPFILTFIFGIINILWDRNALPTPKSETVLDSSILFRLLLVGQNFFFYLKQTFLPFHLMFVHPRISPRINEIWDYLPIISIAIILCISGALFIKHKAKALNLYLSFLVSISILFPILGFSEIYYMRFSYVAEHYLNLAMASLLAPVVIYLSSKKFGKIVIITYAGFCMFQTYRYVPFYENEKKIMEMTLEKNPNSMLPHNILGLLYKNENNTEKAMYHYNKSIENHPNAAAYYNRASLHEKNGDIEKAKINYEQAIKLNPYYGNTYNNLAVIYIKLKEPILAEEYFKKAILADRTDPKFYYNLGYFYETQNRYKEAHQLYLQAFSIQPNNEIFVRAFQRTKSN